MKNLSDKTKIPFCDFQKNLITFFEVKPKKELSDKAKRILHKTLCVIQLADVAMSALYFLFDKVHDVVHSDITYKITEFLVTVKLTTILYTFPFFFIFVLAIRFHVKYYNEIEQQEKWKLVLKLILMIIVSLIEFPLSYWAGFYGLLIYTRIINSFNDIIIPARQ